MRTEITPEPALLGFLREHPLHGYDLYKQVDEQLGPVWNLGQSQMYAILKEYEARGWIQTAIESQGDRPPRKVCQLTPAGQQAFDAWLTQPAHGLREFRVDFFVRLYFARAAGSAQARRLIDQQIAASRQELEHLQSLCTGTDSAPEDFPNQVRRFRIEQLTTIVNWLEHNRSQLIPSPKTRRANPRSALTKSKSKV